MPIPPFTLDRVLPPFTGQMPSFSSDLMSPYTVSVADVVVRFSTTQQRRAILVGWLKYRQDLRALGVSGGFEWLDGSFVEDKEPNDLDLVVFLHRPALCQTDQAFRQLIQDNPMLFVRSTIKHTYSLDVLYVDLAGSAGNIVSASTYWLQLFSHQRSTNLWKGMLRVQQDDMHSETSLLASLTSSIQGVQP